MICLDLVFLMAQCFSEYTLFLFFGLYCKDDDGHNGIVFLHIYQSTIIAKSGFHIIVI